MVVSFPLCVSSGSSTICYDEPDGGQKAPVIKFSLDIKIPLSSLLLAVTDFHKEVDFTAVPCPTDGQPPDIRLPTDQSSTAADQYDFAAPSAAQVPIPTKPHTMRNAPAPSTGGVAMGTHPVPGELDAESLARMSSLSPGVGSNFVPPQQMLYPTWSGMMERDPPASFGKGFGEGEAAEMEQQSESVSAREPPSSPPPPMFGGQRAAGGGRDPSMEIPATDACRGLDGGRTCSAGGDGMGRYQSQSRAMMPQGHSGCMGPEYCQSPPPIGGGHSAYMGPDYCESPPPMGGAAPLACRKVMARKAGMPCRDGRTGQPMMPGNHELGGVPASSAGPPGPGPEQRHMFSAPAPGALGMGTSPAGYYDVGYCCERF